MTIQAVIWDIGGVLTTSPVQSIRRFEVDAGLPDGALRPLLASHEGAWSRFEKSELTPADFMKAFEAEALELGHAIDGGAFLAAFFGALVVRDDYVRAVRFLRGKVKTGAITNNIAREDPRAPHSGPLAIEELFDVVIESSKVGVRKPDPRIYHLACEELGVTPDEAAFLDDFGVNLKAARALGMMTIKVDETDSALRELEKVLGLEFPPPQ